MHAAFELQQILACVCNSLTQVVSTCAWFLAKIPLVKCECHSSGFLQPWILLKHSSFLQVSMTKLEAPSWSAVAGGGPLEAGRNSRENNRRHVGAGSSSHGHNTLFLLPRPGTIRSFMRSYNNPPPSLNTPYNTRITITIHIGKL